MTSALPSLPAPSCEAWPASARKAPLASSCQTRPFSTCAYQGAEGYYQLLTEGHPVEIRKCGDAGRGIFATRDIEAGETVIAATPAVAHPTLDSIGKVCYLCLGPMTEGDEATRSREEGSTPSESQASLQDDISDTSQDAGQFESGLFCSQQCAEIAEEDFFGVERQHDWTVLHSYCKTSGLKFPLAARRFVCMVLSGAASPNALSCLCYTQANSSSAVPPWAVEQHKILASVLASSMTDHNLERLRFLTPEWYAALIGRFQLNAFKLQPLSVLAVTAWQGGSFQLDQAACQAVLGEGSVGTGIYLLPSFLNHSCDPNVDISWPQDATAFLVARRRILRDEELTITYMDASLDVGARKEYLTKAYGFECNCQRCQDGD